MSDEVTSTRIDRETEERFVSLRRALGISSFGINQMRLAPGQRNRIHRHLHQEEVYVVLEGTLTLVIEGVPNDYEQGSLVRVGPSVRRQLVNRHRVPVLLMALGGFASYEHQGRDGEAFPDWAATEPGAPQELPPVEDLPESELVG